MSRAVGNEVVVQTLGGKRGVIVQIAHHGRYRVRVEGVTMWCGEADLAEPPRSNQHKRRAAKPRSDSHATAGSNSSPPARIDLHGCTVEEALARLMDALDRALRAGADRIAVVHGKGSGRVKHAVQRRLASMPSVAAYEIDEHNAGVTWVYL